MSTLLAQDAKHDKVKRGGPRGVFSVRPLDTRHINMSFPFSELCTLLSRLEDVELHDPPLLPTVKAERLRAATESWFLNHRKRIDELAAGSASALLSSLLPERRNDRVYGMQAPGLCRILSRCLNLSVHRAKDLQAYRQPGCGDLGSCVKRMLQAGGPPAKPSTSVEEVDAMLQLLAGGCRFSDLKHLQLPAGSSEMRDRSIGDIFKRCSPVEGKWLARLILKDFAPVIVNEALVLKGIHFLLPDVLRFQNDFEVAMSLLRGPLHEYPEHPDPRSERLHRQGVAAKLRLTVGVKVGRPNFHKARSVEQCMKMMVKQKWVLERKYDGEYCEVHIKIDPTTKPVDWITIFSKSGKDSTHDRRRLHQTLIDCLGLDKPEPERKIKRQAILLGELVVYSDRKDDHDVLPFEKLRKHVTRSGVSLGTELDSPRHAHEHLAIIWFDILLLDDVLVMSKSIEERRKYLREVYTKIHKRAHSAEWKIINFADEHHSRGKRMLMRQFAFSNAQRCEGLVIKPCSVPYFTLEASPNDYRHSFIKLKKDYIAECGDESDFAVIGASYNAQQALKSGIKNIKYTDFHLGCLMNKDDVVRFGSRPVFKYAGTIQQEACIPKAILQTANILANLNAKPHTAKKQPAEFDLELGTLCKIEVVFDKPFVFEVLGSGFDKPSNCDFFMLRHARVKKLHEDRNWQESVSFQELQEQAKVAKDMPVASESQAVKSELAKLERKCRRKIEKERSQRTPSSRATTTPGTAGKSRLESDVVSTAKNVAQTGQTSPSIPVRQPLAAIATNAASRVTDLNRSTPACESDADCRKRPCDAQEATPCPPIKRRRGAPECAILEDQRPPAEQRSAVSLSDLTNKAITPGEPAGGTQKPKSNPGALAQLPRKLLGLLRPAVTTLSNKCCASTSQVAKADTCRLSSCLLAKVVVYLAPCVSRTPYIAHDLLRLHNVLIVPSLKHWDRDSHAHPSLAATVRESQAYGDRRKIILVEANRQQAVKDVVSEAVDLNGSRLRERVEVYDWRVLEDCRKHGSSADLLKRHFLGATMFDGEQDRTLFVSRLAWLSELDMYSRDDCETIGGKSA